MNRWIGVFVFASVLATAAVASAKGPEVDLVDNKLSINAEAVPLARLLRLIDLATGMKSKVPTELANRNVSVKFSGLSLNDGFRKLFQGQPFDYVVVQGQGIIVTAASQSLSTPESVPQYNAGPVQQPVEQPFVQEFPPAPTMPVQQFPPGVVQPGVVPPQQQPQQPAMVQTPFGPIPNPRAQQQQNTFGAVPAQQQNSLFQQPSQLGQPSIGQPVPGFPATPLNTTNPFGAPQQPGAPTIPNNQINQQNNGLFGAAPPVLGSSGTQQR